MEHYAGIDVSLESASPCVVDATGRIVREAKVASEPEVLIGWFSRLGLAVTRIGLEAGPLDDFDPDARGSGDIRVVDGRTVGQRQRARLARHGRHATGSCR